MCMEPVGDGAIRVTTGRSEDDMVGLSGGFGPGAVPAPSPLGGVGGLITGRPWLPRAGFLARALSREAAAQRERVVLWTPVAFGAGAALYLAFREEPPLAPGLALAAVLGLAAGLAWVWGRRFWVTAVLALAATAAVGFCVAKLHSDTMAAPIAPVRPGFTRVDGWVVDVDTPSPRGERLLIAPVRIRGLTPAETPVREAMTSPGTPGSRESAE